MLKLPTLATTILAALAATRGMAATPDYAAIQTLVVIYAENRSFDNLYGTFPGANGLAEASPQSVTQLDRDGSSHQGLAETGMLVVKQVMLAEAGVDWGDTRCARIPKPASLRGERLLAAVVLGDGHSLLRTWLARGERGQDNQQRPQAANDRGESGLGAHDIFNRFVGGRGFFTQRIFKIRGIPDSGAPELDTISSRRHAA